MIDPFDSLMTGTCTVNVLTGTTKDDYGQRVDGDYTANAEVACRHSTKGSGREYKQDKKATVTSSKFFMRPQAFSIGSKDQIVFDGTIYNVLDVLKVRARDSSVHHLEIEVEEIEPGDSGS